jgi:hypothetical protein
LPLSPHLCSGAVNGKQEPFDPQRSFQNTICLTLLRLHSNIFLFPQNLRGIAVANCTVAV